VVDDDGWIGGAERCNRGAVIDQIRHAGWAHHHGPADDEWIEVFLGGRDQCYDIVEQCIGALVEEQEAIGKDRDAARILDDTGTIDLAVIKISGDAADRICRGAIGEHRLDPIGQWVAMFRQVKNGLRGRGCTRSTTTRDDREERCCGQHERDDADTDSLHTGLLTAGWVTNFTDSTYLILSSRGWKLQLRRETIAENPIDRKGWCPNNVMTGMRCIHRHDSAITWRYRVLYRSSRPLMGSLTGALIRNRMHWNATSKGIFVVRSGEGPPVGPVQLK